MERDEIRLACLRLAVERTVGHQEQIARAEDFFDFVVKKSESVPNQSKEAVKEPNKDTHRDSKNASGKKVDNVKNLL